MNRRLLTSAFAVMVAASAFAQHNEANDASRLSAKSGSIQPQPDKDGIYSLDEGVIAPKIYQSNPVNHPSHVKDKRPVITCSLYAEVGPEGKISNIQPDQLCGKLEDKFIKNAIKCVQSIKLKPATLNDRVIPVHAHFMVRFTNDFAENYPLLFLRSENSKIDDVQVDSKPTVVRSADPEFSEEARIAGVQGFVIVTLIVNEAGNPTHVKALATTGYGLDEQAVKAVSKYTFKPARKSGVPVSYPLTIITQFWSH